MEFSNEGLKAAGIFEDGKGGGITSSSAVVRYVAGVVHRERERLAKAFKGHLPEDAIKRILNEDDDAAIFIWSGPGRNLAGVKRDGTPGRALPSPVSDDEVKSDEVGK